MDRDQLEQRARAPVAQCLIRQLLVPKLYFGAPWPGGDQRVDLLAVDRAGVGDVHIVEVKFEAARALQAIPQLLAVPAQYRWIAFFHETVNNTVEPELMSRRALYPQSGMGRVGVIEVVRMAGDDLGANVLVRPERFPGSSRPEVSRLLETVPPDIQFD